MLHSQRLYESMKATKLFSVLKIKSLCWFLYTDIFTFSFRKFHCWNLKAKKFSFIYFLLCNSRSKIKSFNWKCRIFCSLLEEVDSGVKLESRTLERRRKYCLGKIGTGKSSPCSTDSKVDSIFEWMMDIFLFLVIPC